MTIAVAFLTPEGVVLGADSTASQMNDNGVHYFNFNQKVFEVGEDSTLGFVTWGTGELGGISLRTIVAEVADDFKINPPVTFQHAFDRMADHFWHYYQSNGFYQRYKNLEAKMPFGLPINFQQGAASVRTEQEEYEFNVLHQNLHFGFCLGGHVLPVRTPGAIIIDFNPAMNARPVNGYVMAQHSTVWKGVPNMIQRLMMGYDEKLKNELLNSGLWSGTQQELSDILARQCLAHPIMPIRDGIDYVYTCIHSTIKAMKFSSLTQICGGPIEIAVITSDRKFRWVKHKSWDAAITDGEC